MPIYQSVAPNMSSKVNQSKPINRSVGTTASSRPMVVNQSIAGPQSKNVGSVLGAATGGTGGGGSSNRSVDTSGQEKRISDSQKAAEDAAQAKRDETRAMIDSEFNNIMGGLSTQESAINAQQPIVEGQISQQAQADTASIEGQKAQQMADLGGQETSAQTGTKSAIANARQTYNELLSGASRFGGSAQGAFGELLGRSTAQTMGNAQQALQDTMTKIAGEKTRLTQFYDSKVMDVKQKSTLAIQSAQAEFRNQINKIRDSRTATQQWKAAQNLSALSDFKARIAQISDAANTAKNALDQWAQERQSVLQQTASAQAAKFGLPQYQALNESWKTAGLQATPDVQSELLGKVGSEMDPKFLQEIGGRLQAIPRSSGVGSELDSLLGD